MINRLIDKYPNHRELIQLGEQCIWCWTCFKLAKSYCDDEQLEGCLSIDPILVDIFKEYALLQLAKLHDNVSTGRHQNHTIEYVIQKYSNNATLISNYNILCSDNAELIDSIKSARSKIIAHNDVRAHSTDAIYGQFSANSEITYFYSLHKLMNSLYNHAGIGVFPEWPTLIDGHIKEFTDLVISSKNR